MVKEVRRSRCETRFACERGLLARRIGVWGWASPQSLARGEQRKLSSIRLADAWDYPQVSMFRKAKLEHPRSGCVALSKMAEVYESSCTTDTPYFAPLVRYTLPPSHAMPRVREVLCHVAQ